MLHTSGSKYSTQKLCKKNRHLCTITQLCRATALQLRHIYCEDMWRRYFCLTSFSGLSIRHISTIGKNLLNSSISSTCPHNMMNFGPLTAEIGEYGAPQQISTGFASWLCYCTDITQLCTMTDRLLGWYTVYILSGIFP